MKLFFNFLFLAVASVAFAADSANEQVLKSLLKQVLSPADMQARTQHIYFGKNAQGGDCNVELWSEYKQIVEKGPNGTSDLNASFFQLDTKKTFWIGFGGQGPEGFYGEPTNTLSVKGDVVSLVKEDMDKAVEKSVWTIDLTFSGTKQLENLTAIRGEIAEEVKKARSGACASLKHMIRLASADFDTIEKLINAQLDEGNEVQIFNGCSVPRSAPTKLVCGFAIDGENNEQGEITLIPQADGTFKFESLEMYED